MKFTKEPPYELGKLCCIVNATIETLNMNIPKLSQASIYESDRALVAIGYGYDSSMDLGTQWIQLVDMLERMDISSEKKEELLEIAADKYEHLDTKGELK